MAEEINVELIKQLIVELLGPAVSVAVQKESRKIEDNMNAQQEAFQNRIENRVEHHHSENRVRFEINLNEVRAVLNQAKDNSEQIRDFNANVLRLVEKVAEMNGRKAGDDAAQTKRDKQKENTITFWKWALGLLGSGGVTEMVMRYFHSKH
jgi:hypothetical protein